MARIVVPAKRGYGNKTFRTFIKKVEDELNQIGVPFQHENLFRYLQQTKLKRPLMDDLIMDYLDWRRADAFQNNSKPLNT